MMTSGEIGLALWDRHRNHG